MRVGVNLPHYGPETSPDVVVKFAVQAEQLRLSTLWVIERVLRPQRRVDLPMELGLEVPPQYSNVLSPLETLVHVAGVTDRIKLGTGVINALFHTPAILGRRLATVDHYCGGRLIAGMGQAYQPDEFASANVPMSRRGRGFDEFITALRAVWGPDPVEYAGEFYRVPRSQIGPKPIQPGGPPLMLGATSVPASSRAGRLGIGLNPAMSTWDLLEKQVAAFRSAASEAGHDVSTLPIIARGALQDEDGPLALGGQDPETGKFIRAPLNGSRAQLSEDLERLTEMGVEEVSFDMMSGGYPLARQFDTLAMLAEL